MNSYPVISNYPYGSDTDSTHVNAQHGFVHLQLMQISNAQQTSPWISYMNT